MLPKGTELTCPKCNRVMARSRYDIYPNTVLSLDQWEAVDGNLRSGGPMRCPYDSTPYAVHRGMRGEVHIKEEGWV